ncbi:hypothetical protein RRG08_022110 [Elysia crispata]|uniref:Uncharacterized protein n=1 Tax=Elysia crispata TaxID=231223 RepID=A0AAE0Y112_9GAST|nr:hypothetical protein RRG08_022110 [Elysia crispata]
MSIIKVIVSLLFLVAMTTGNKKCRQGKECKPDDRHTYWPPMKETYCCKRSDTHLLKPDPDDAQNPAAWICVCLPYVLKYPGVSG